uniref:Uncharacterized protein n=1 Tax=Rhizophora mucronata TaxID=61149 RepID=A0A2P2NI76_RHIMU
MWRLYYLLFPLPSSPPPPPSVSIVYTFGCFILSHPIGWFLFLRPLDQGKKEGLDEFFCIFNWIYLDQMGRILATEKMD